MKPQTGRTGWPSVTYLTFMVERTAFSLALFLCIPVRDGALRSLQPHPIIRNDFTLMHLGGRSPYYKTCAICFLYQNKFHLFKIFGAARAPWARRHWQTEKQYTLNTSDTCDNHYYCDTESPCETEISSSINNWRNSKQWARNKAPHHHQRTTQDNTCWKTQ